MTQDDYVVMKKSSREKLIKELKEVKKENQQLKKERKSLMTALNTSREKYNNDKVRYRRKYKDLKKQKADVVEFLKYSLYTYCQEDAELYEETRIKILRMLGEKDD